MKIIGLRRQVQCSHLLAMWARNPFQLLLGLFSWSGSEEQYHMVLFQFKRYIDAILTFIFDIAVVKALTEFFIVGVA